MKPRFLVLTLSMIVAFAILVSLGVWQLQRRDWKHDLIDRIEARADAPAAPLEQVLARWQRDRDIEYMRVEMTGELHPEREFHIYTIHDGAPGWRVVSPFETESGKWVMLDRGFVPEALKAPESRSDQPALEDREFTVTGLARAQGEPNVFTPDSEPARNRWYWRDLEGIVSQLPDNARARMAPFFVEAEAGALPGEWPRGGVTQLQLMDRHLSYALTWFGLALTLLGVCAAYVLSRWRGTRTSTQTS
ncbi:MAG: SURF1 family protein [Dichotomicrobium sp.]